MNTDVINGDRRPVFFDLWKEHHFNTSVLSHQAHVPESVIVSMLRHQSVPRGDAARVLKVLSHHLHQTLSLDTVRIPTITGPLEDNRPTFADLRKRHDFNLHKLIIRSGLPYPTVLDMFRSNPVPKANAEKVLAALSNILGREYNLSTVRVALCEEGDEQNAAK